MKMMSKATSRRKKQENTYCSMTYRMSGVEKLQFEDRINRRYHFYSLLMTIKARKLDFPVDKYINFYLKNETLVPARMMGKLIDFVNRNNIQFNIRELSKIVEAR